MEPIDIWRSAKLMVDLHGRFAPQECQRQALALAAAGKTDGEAVWDAIRRAAESLIERGPPQDIPGIPPCR